MRILKIAALALGALLLFFIIRKVGMNNLLMGFQRLGWRIFIPIIIIFPCHLLFTLSWRLFLERFEHYSISFWQLFRIKVAGEAANTLTPLNFAGGDSVRIWLLSRNFPVSISGASVVIDRTLQILAVTTIIFLGNMVALVRLNLPAYAKVLVVISATLLLFFIILFLFQQTRGFFQKLILFVEGLKIRKFSEKTLQRVEELDRYVGEFYRKDKGLFFLCFSFHFVARLVGVLEIYVLAHFLGVPMGYWEALFFAAVIPLTNLIGGIVPGTLGILEGVVSSLFLALQWDPVSGLVIQIARRFRAVVWIATGLFFILSFKTDKVEGKNTLPAPL